MNCRPADICFILEGTYPYIPGGVSSWVHDLIRAHPDLSFHLLAIVPETLELNPCYELPDNVSGLTNVVLQQLPEVRLSPKAARAVINQVQQPVSSFLRTGELSMLSELCGVLGSLRGQLGAGTLLDSKAAWEQLLHSYESRVPDVSFLDYFWTWRAALGAFYSAMLCEIPVARIYHPVSTGYAGLVAARAHLETGRPVILTEHGIYTNERRIEISSARWLYEVSRDSLGIGDSRIGIKEIWVELFGSYSRACYDACETIITLYEGNQELQLADGASPEKLRVIPNGIDFDRYSSLERDPSPRPPAAVALIGRVVPIKDVKTFIRACSLLRQKLGEFEVYVMGPTEEDPDYFRECQEMVQLQGLDDCITFTGKVNLDDYLGRIDAVVLTSISEAQPLVILEAGAAGIPTVATDVGACREMILGSSREEPALGPGGAVTPLANPEATASALFRLLSEPQWHARCSEAIEKRVARYYNKKDLDRTYRDLYQSLLDSAEQKEEAAV